MKRSILVLLVLTLTLGVSLAERPRGHDETSALAARIDAALEIAWRERGLTPAPAANDLELLRRMALDLHGTIPSLEEVRAFEALPPEKRREPTIERLLADPRFHDALAERLARIVVGAGRKPDDLLYRRRRFVAWL